MNLKFQLPEKYYQPAEELCKMGHNFESRDIYLHMPERLDEDGELYYDDYWRITYSPVKRLFIVEENTKGDRYDEFFSTDKPIVIDNFIKYLKVKKVLSEDAQYWLADDSFTESWSKILHDLMKNVDLTEDDCKYLEIDPTRATIRRRSSDLGLI